MFLEYSSNAQSGAKLARCVVHVQATPSTSRPTHVHVFLWPRPPLTVLEDSLHVQAVSGAGLVVRAALQVVRQLPGPRVIDHSGVGGADCV